MNFHRLRQQLDNAARRIREGVGRVLGRGNRGAPAPSQQELDRAATNVFDRLDRQFGGPGNLATARRLDQIREETERALAREIEAQREQQRRWEELRRLGVGGPGDDGGTGGLPSGPRGRPGGGNQPGGLPGSSEPTAPQGGAPRWIGPELDQDALDLLHGTLHEVSSSNVHSIGMQVSQPGARTGTLLIRFLGTRPGGKRGGKGPTYAYRDVPVELYRAFRQAASMGRFVWDHIRVRGTVSGHRFAYELVGVVNGYVPRQAGIRRGEPGEWFLRRTWTGYRVNRQTGKLEQVTLQSQLPERRVSTRGPNPGRGPGLDSLRFGR